MCVLISERKLQAQNPSSIWSLFSENLPEKFSVQQYKPTHKHVLKISVKGNCESRRKGRPEETMGNRTDT